MSAAVGTVTGTVASGGTAINGARVVAYNTDTKVSVEVTTVGGAFTFANLPAGPYVLGVQANGYQVAQYPEFTLTAAQTYDLANHNPNHIELTEIVPQFTCHSQYNGATGVLSIMFHSDQPLQSNPSFTRLTGGGTLDTSAVDVSTSPSDFDVTYTAAGGDTLVKIRMQGGGGSEDFTFEVSSTLVSTASTNMTNATGATMYMMGAQDMTSVYIPPMALVGTGGDTTAISLAVVRYGNPGDPAPGTGQTTASGVYDFKFGTQGVEVNPLRVVTLTLSFTVPLGMTQDQFMAKLRIGYFSEVKQAWLFSTDPSSGITNVQVNWTSQTVKFDVKHLSKFAVFSLDKEVKNFGLATGYNILSVPFAEAGVTTAEELAQAIPNATIVYKWDAATQAWVGHAKGTLTNNFNIASGDGALVRVADDGVWEPSGAWPTVAFTFQTGYNMASLPSSKAASITTAEELAQAIPNATIVYTWDATSQGWVGHAKGSLTNNFTIGAGDGFVVFVTGDTPW